MHISVKAKCSAISKLIDAGRGVIHIFAMTWILFLTFVLLACLFLQRHPILCTESPFPRITSSSRSTSSTSLTMVLSIDGVSAPGTAVDNCLTVCAASPLEDGILFRGENPFRQDWSMTKACCLHSKQKSLVHPGGTDVNAGSPPVLTASKLCVTPFPSFRDVLNLPTKSTKCQIAALDISQ